MTTMLIYDKIVPLNKERHRELKLRIDNVEFARGIHFVPMAAVELFHAARDLALVFAGSDDKNLGLVALLGIKEGQNLFVNKEGQWQNGTYLPAYIRRYPFVLAKSKEDNFTVCFDESYSGFSTKEGKELFAENGEASELLNSMVGFLDGYTRDMERTKQFVERLVELDLLTKRELRVTDKQGRSYFLRDLHLVDEEKLAKLDDATVGQLHREGYLGWIYAHLVSVGNASRLPHMLPADEAAATAAEAAANEPAADPATGE
jgi:hypothetical protein